MKCTLGFAVLELGNPVDDVAAAYQAVFLRCLVHLADLIHEMTPGTFHVQDQCRLLWH